MTARLQSLVTGFDNAEVVRDRIATILLEESASQQTKAQSVAATVTRADDSDYTATAAVDSEKHLEEGYYVATAGTLVAGVGTWTCVSPTGAEEEFTSTAADDDLLFPTLGITFTVTAVSEEWDTGDSLTVWSPDPNLWKLRVFTERTNPWQEWLDAPDRYSDDAVPIVAVGLDTGTFDPSKSDLIERQHCDAIFWIDCHGYGVSTQTADGHDPGDARAAIEALRAARLVRRFLMASTYTYLDLRETVGRRFTEQIRRWPPDEERQQWLAVQKVVCFRIYFGVSFNEFSPQYEPVTISQLNLELKRSETGETWIELQYDS